MKERTIIVDYSDESDPEFVNTADRIIKGLTDNSTTFNNPDVPIVTVQLERDEFDQAIDDAAGGDPSKTADKDEKRVTLAKSVKKNGRYVEKVADGDLSIMLSSGYSVSDEPSPIGPFDPTTGLKARAEKIGELDAEVDSVAKARGYLFAFTAYDNPEANPYNWTLRWSSKRKTSLIGLQSGQKYKVSCAAVGASDEVNFCDPIARIVQ